MRGLVFGAKVAGINFALFLLVLSDSGWPRANPMVAKRAESIILLETGCSKQ